MALFTAGYEGLDIDSFLAGLRHAGVEKVVDVRQLPVSRKKGFSKTSFAEQLRASGIEYEHVKALGCPKPIRDQYKKDRDWANYTKHFRAYMLHNPRLCAMLPARPPKLTPASFVLKQTSCTATAGLSPRQANRSTQSCT